MAALRLILEERGPGYVPPASRLERLAFDCLVDGGLAVPVRQHPLPSRAGPGRVDLAYPDARLIIEADSRRWHTRVADFEVDRRRDNEATALGWQVLRVTWRDLVDRPGWVRSMVRSCLEAGSAMTDTRSPRASRRIPGVRAPRTRGLEVEAVR
jgi:very-short-patch-repair endonuclease